MHGRTDIKIAFISLTPVRSRPNNIKKTFIFISFSFYADITTVNSLSILHAVNTTEMTCSIIILQSSTLNFALSTVSSAILYEVFTD